MTPKLLVSTKAGSTKRVGPTRNCYKLPRSLRCGIVGGPPNPHLRFGMTLFAQSQNCRKTSKFAQSLPRRQRVRCGTTLTRVVGDFLRKGEDTSITKRVTPRARERRPDDPSPKTAASFCHSFVVLAGAFAPSRPFLSAFATVGPRRRLSLRQGVRLPTRGRSAAIPPYAHLFPADAVGLELLKTFRAKLLPSPHRIGGPRIRCAPRRRLSCGPSSPSRGSRPARSLAAARLRSLAVASCHPRPLSLGRPALVHLIHQRAGRVGDALGRAPLRVARPGKAV